MFEKFNFFSDFFGDDYFNKYFNSMSRKNHFNFDENNPDHLPSGDVKITTGENGSGSWEKKEWVSPDGFTKMSSYVYTSKSGKLTNDKNLLKNRIKKAVSEEDYETAAKLKKELDNFDLKKEEDSK